VGTWRAPDYFEAMNNALYRVRLLQGNNVNRLRYTENHMIRGGDMEIRYTIYCYTAPYKSPKWILSKLSATLTARELNREMRAKGCIERYYPIKRREPTLFLCSPFYCTEQTLRYL